MYLYTHYNALAINQILDYILSHFFVLFFPTNNQQSTPLSAPPSISLPAITPTTQVGAVSMALRRLMHFQGFLKSKFQV